MSYTPPVPLLLTSDKFETPEQEAAYLRNVATYLCEHIDARNSVEPSVRYGAESRFPYESVRVFNPMPSK